MFEEIVSKTIKHEGGYVDHPNDRGGKTKYGITETVARNYGYEGRMQDLSKETAKEIYRQEFWDKVKADEFDEEIAYVLFDTAVNMGAGRAVMLLQETYNRVTPDNNISVDGIVGPETIGAVNQADREHILLGYIAGRTQRYFDIVDNNDSQKVFIRGWLSRMITIVHQIYSHNSKEEVKVGYTIDEVLNALKEVLEPKLGG